MLEAASGSVYDAKRGSAFILACTFIGRPCPTPVLVEVWKPEGAIGDETDDGAVEAVAAVVAFESTDVLDSSDEPLPRAEGEATRLGALFVAASGCGGAAVDVAPPKLKGTPV